jgi:hypothetical protein
MSSGWTKEGCGQSSSKIVGSRTLRARHHFETEESPQVGSPITAIHFYFSSIHKVRVYNPLKFTSIQRIST